jgi:hypothetical protein
MGHD